MGELQRQTQFKSKAETNMENVNAGLFTYPILQAADILLYKASRVPVGQDQEQHLELSREISRKFNARYGQTFPEPKTMFTSTPKILGLDGQAKMSKSLDNSIAIDDEPGRVWKKLSRAYTDPNRLRRSDPGNPDICNIYALHEFFSENAQRAEINDSCRKAQIGCVDCKKLLAQGLEKHVGPIRERWAELRANPKPVHDALEKGRDHCLRLANSTMDEVRDKLGLKRDKTSASIEKAPS